MFLLKVAHSMLLCYYVWDSHQIMAVSLLTVVLSFEIHLNSFNKKYIKKSDEVGTLFICVIVFHYSEKQCVVCMHACKQTNKQRFAK